MDSQLWQMLKAKTISLPAIPKSIEFIQNSDPEVSHYLLGVLAQSDHVQGALLHFALSFEYDFVA